MNNYSIRNLTINAYDDTILSQSTQFYTHRIIQGSFIPKYSIPYTTPKYPLGA